MRFKLLIFLLVNLSSKINQFKNFHLAVKAFLCRMNGFRSNSSSSVQVFANSLLNMFHLTLHETRLKLLKVAQSAIYN